MAICEVCGNDYDKAFQVVRNGEQHTFDSFECAINAMAPTCGHCGCRIIGHGVEATARCAAQLRPPGRRRGASPTGSDDGRPGSEVGEPLRLLAELAAGGRVEAAERRRLHLVLLVGPGPGHAAVDQEGANRLRRLRAEHLAPVLLREDPRSARVHQQGRVPGGQERTGAGVSGSGSGARGNRSGPRRRRRQTSAARSARAPARRGPVARPSN